jgi:radical SAM superfamily enzyme YgiQ (UPF0313 family)
MNILLISANTETVNMPVLPMGLGLVAAAVKRAGHAVKFLDLMTATDPDDALTEAISRFTPGVIGISIRNVDDQTSLSTRFLLEKARTVVARCKALTNAPVVLGGAGYSMFPESALEYLGADMGIQGEGEGAFAALVNCIDKGLETEGIPGLYIRGQGSRTPSSFESCLDDWTYPDPDIFDVERFKDPAYFLPFQTRRGCPLKCSYCATAVIEGSRIRTRSIDRVVNDLARWSRAGFSRIFFVDNTFNLPADYVQALCERLIEEKLGLNFRAIVYPGRTEEALIKAMAGAGCSEVSLGFESGSDSVLSGMGKRYDADDVRKTARLLGDAGIRRMGFLLLGGPHETRETVLESLRFVDSLNLEAMKITVGIRIYPMTALAAQAVSEGYIQADDDLLRPVFYIREGLEDWLRQTVSQWAADRPNWITA